MRLFALVALLSASMAGIASASGVAPKPGHWHGATTPRGGKDDEALFIVSGGKISRQQIGAGWKAIVAPTDFKCNEAFIQIPTTQLVIRNGRFSYHGTAVDTAGNKSTGISGRLDWTGVFTSSRTVKGTMRFRTSHTPVFNLTEYKFSLAAKPCDTGVLPWKGAWASR